MVEYEANNREPKDTDRLLGYDGGQANGDRSSMLSPEDGELQDRLGFIRKVYGILTVQLSFTVGFMTMTKMSDETNEWMKHQSVLAFVLVLVSFIP